ncbi:protein kinase, partial [Streptomyces minutiscleroticus]|uniref:protein kinase n=1 Tax=Streptomyces minutiscleroticus TaxID=68238 RepID=UPI003D9E2FBB
ARPGAGAGRSRAPAVLPGPPLGGQAPRVVPPQAPETGGDIRAARAGAIAAYRAGARAAARVQEAQQAGRDAALPAPRPRPLGGGSVPEQPDASGAGRGTGAEAASPPGRIADPYGVAGRTNPWHGAMPRPGAPAAGGGNGGGTDAGGRSRGELPGPGTTVPGPHGGGGEGRPGAPVGGAGTNRHSGHAGPGGPDVLGGPPAQRQYHDELQGPYGGAPDAPWTGAAHHGGPGALAPAAPSGHASEGTAASWDQPASAPRRGPATALAAERARQARMAVVGPVTERWAPEQAGPVHENWQLAAPIGPATDLWALGALLFRAVQGHAPYPEESTAELVQLVCSEPPAFAEECGPLRPVVESLLRQDPTERIDFEELNGWLRSLVRSAPEPDAGTYVVPVPPPPSDPARLPIVRRRGELVRRRRAGLPDAHGRHKRSRQERPAPRRLGRTLLLLILLALAGAVAYAVAFMPKAGTDDAAGGRTGTAGSVSPDPGHSSDAEGNDEGQGGSDEAAGEDGGTSPSSSSAQSSQTTGAEVAQGFSLRKDAEGFRVAVASGWDRAPRNGQGQVVYSKGDFELIVVPGRDSTGEFGDDPMEYQRERERELQPFRDSTWATSSGMRTVEVGGRTMVEGQFTWQDADGQEVYVRNLAMVVDGRYHVVQVRGPEAERDEVTRLYEQASTTYQVTGG